MVGPHTSVREKDSDEDPVESLLKKTGCIELHFKVQVYNKMRNLFEYPRTNELTFLDRPANQIRL